MTELFPKALKQSKKISLSFTYSACKNRRTRYVK